MIIITFLNYLDGSKAEEFFSIFCGLEKSRTEVNKDQGVSEVQVSTDILISSHAVLFLPSVLLSDCWTKTFFLPGWKTGLGEWKSKRGGK